jgi:UDP-N-acetyl-2-amino-2-deoxyglucuronate dehydrogenase
MAATDRDGPRREGTFRFGLVGLGMGGETHARQLSIIPGVALLGVYGRNHDRTRAFAGRFHVPRVYTTFDAMLGDPEVDAVIVATPHGLHRDFAVRAAGAGKHVIVEKPLEVTLPRAQDIITACEAGGVTLGVIFQMRFGNAAQRLKRAIDGGAFGRIIIADVIDKEFRTPDYYARDAWRGTVAYEGGGALMTQSIHVLDLVQWLAGPVTSVFAKTKTALHAIEVEDLVTAVATFANGACGVIESSTAAYPAFKSRVEIHGTNGSAIINGEWDETMFWRTRTGGEGSDAPPGFTFADVSDPRRMPEERHRVQLEEFVAAVRAGRPPAVSGREALTSLALAMAIYESAATGREVAVQDILARDGVSP